MKEVWVKVVPWDKQKALISLESGADALVIPEGFSRKVKELGLIKTVAKDGDIKLGEDVVEFEINNKQDEKTALRMSKSKMLILRMKDWTIIPLENLIAETKGLMVEVKNASEAQTAVQILEKGVDGVVLNIDDMNEIKKAISLIKNTSGTLQLEVIRIKNTKPVGMGDRVCVDTCTNMVKGEGMLAGNSSSAMFLVHSESIENPYVEARPFRVNAGAVHAYTMLPGGKTKYLSELNSGDESLIVNSDGSTQTAIVGRVKVERRPMMLVEGESKSGGAVSLILQNAETVRLVTSNGEPKSVVQLEENDEVMGCPGKGGRHFGMSIEETITEK